MAVRGVQTIIDGDYLTLSISSAPAELAVELEKINETGEILLAGFAPTPEIAAFLMVLPEDVYPNFTECLEAAYAIITAASLHEQHVTPLSLLLGTIAWDLKDRTLGYNLEDGMDIAFFAAGLIEKGGDTESIREGIITYVLNFPQQKSENDNGDQEQANSKAAG